MFHLSDPQASGSENLQRKLNTSHFVFLLLAFNTSESENDAMSGRWNTSFFTVMSDKNSCCSSSKENDHVDSATSAEKADVLLHLSAGAQKAEAPDGGETGEVWVGIQF